ncbi:MAG TPA: TIGR04282 family arsenosugar biosynthesis glycosyltransferase, partial [Vicinamibacterales bacterium]|nr:TIGR04282 family arsenosugar biosynthesis glycosyltransferase [Vicinamibacterales bacterium]
MAGDAARVLPVTRPAVAMLARSPRAAGKTRLTSGLPDDAAAALRRALLLDTVEGALGPGWPLHLCVTPADDQRDVYELIAADARLAASAGQCHLHAQVEGNLGIRMADAMARALDAGHDAVVLVGSDLPALASGAIAGAVAALERAGGEERLVFGPARDGGFYLVAARGVWPDAFAGIEWSRDTVLAHTEARARTVGLDVVRVAPGGDVDTMDDLERLLTTAPAGVAPRTRAWA